jgi:hypothetical protein
MTRPSTTPSRRRLRADEDLGPWPERTPTAEAAVVVLLLLMAIVALAILL